jgi:hypothetical protein
VAVKNTLEKFNKVLEEEKVARVIDLKWLLWKDLAVLDILFQAEKFEADLLTIKCSVL